MALFVGRTALYPGHLAGGAELAPAHTVVAVVHKGGMRPPFPHPALLGGAVVLWVRSGVIVVEAHAPAAAKDAVVAFHQRGERGPGRLIESPHGVRRTGHEFNLTRALRHRSPARALACCACDFPPPGELGLAFRTRDRFLPRRALRTLHL